MDNVALSWKMAREIEAKTAPEPLAEVVKAGDLASFLTPADWMPLQELAAELEDAEANLASIEKRLGDLREAQFSRGARRIRDVARLADDVLAGGIPAQEPERTPEGLASLSLDMLRDIESGLRAKERETRDRIKWLGDRLRIAHENAGRAASAAVGARYAELLTEARRLHVLLEAAHQVSHDVLGDPHAWRQERWLAPLHGVPADLKQYDGGHYRTPLLGYFESGAGVSGALERWRAAIAAGCGRPL